MSETVFDHLRHEWTHLEHDITRLFPHGRYHDPGTTTLKETPVSVIDTIEHELQAADETLRQGWNHVAAVLQQHLPQAAAVLRAAEASPVVDAGLRIAHVPPETLDAVAKMLLALDASLGGQSPQSPAGPSEPPAQPDVPADVPQPLSAGPVVGGTAT